jgi:hypothetical protein
VKQAWAIPSRFTGGSGAKQQAVEAGTDALEEAAWDIATSGVLEETFDENGRLVSSRRRQDSASVRFLLASRRPDVYSEKTRLEVGGRVDVEHAIAAGPVITLADVLERQRELAAGEPSPQAAEVIEVTDDAIDSTDGDSS